MKLKVKILRLQAGKPIVILHKETADKLSVNINDRIVLTKGKKNIIAIVDLAVGMLEKDEIAVSNEVVRSLSLRECQLVELDLAPHPQSTHLIYKKLQCAVLDEQEIKKIVSDIVKNALTEPEIAYFVSAIYKCGMSDKETEYLVKAVAGSGKKLKFRGKVVDKHCVGGVAGNRTTLIVVPICAAAGLRMPKTSSRAITSAAGTADAMESVANVEFTLPEIKKIVKKTNACIVWGGALGLAAADDKIIQVEKLLNLDPEPQLLASILAKKMAVDSKYVLIDIPYGKSAKVSLGRAKDLKAKFEKFGKYFKIDVRCVLTDGSQPIGNGVGPVLEVRDTISILKQDQNRPRDLEDKSLMLAGKILEMVGKTEKNEGKKLAEKILRSGKAFEKFKEIVKIQGGSLSDKRLETGNFLKEIKPKRKGIIASLDNKKINFLARVLGCPADKGSGIYIHKHCGEKIDKNEVLFTLYSESEHKLREALKLYKKVNPVEIK